MEPEEKARICAAFINRLRVTFTDAPGRNQAKFLQELIAQLAVFSTPVLEEAAGHILRTRKSTKWPAIAVCYEACEVARARLEPAETQVAPRPAAQSSYPLPDKVAASIAVQADWPLVRNAIENGWIVRLVDYVREHRQLPDMGTCEKLFEASRALHQRAFDAPGANTPGEIAFYLATGLKRRADLYGRLCLEAYETLSRKGQLDAK